MSFVCGKIQCETYLLKVLEQIINFPFGNGLRIQLSPPCSILVPHSKGYRERLLRVSKRITTQNKPYTTPSGHRV